MSGQWRWRHGGARCELEAREIQNDGPKSQALTGVLFQEAQVCRRGMRREFYGPSMEFWAKFTPAIKSNRTSNYNIKCISKANKMEILNNRVYIAGKNFTATKMRSMIKEAIFLRTRFSLEPLVYCTES